MGRFKINFDDIKLPDGEKSVYSFVEIKEGVCILPIIEEDGAKEIVMVEQYRHPIKKWEFELPAGGVSEDENPTKTAERELEEETGYIPGKIRKLGSFYPSAGSTNEKIHIYLAEELEKGEKDLDVGEEMKVKKVALKELKDMISRGEFKHGAGIAALAKYCW